MATTNFVNGTVIVPDWLNDVDAMTYDQTITVPWKTITWTNATVTHSGAHTWSGNQTYNGTATFNGTLAGNIASGTYTPTIVNGVNVAASTPYNTTSYIRIGNMAIISGFLDIDVTAASTLTGLTISLPFTTSTSSFRQGNGYIVRTNGASLTSIVGSITMDPTNEVMAVSFTSDADITNRGFQFMFFVTNIT